MAFTPNGKTLIAGDFDKALSFWNVATGGRHAVAKGADETLSHLTVSPDGKVAVSAHSFSEVIELWDIESAKQLGWFRLPAGRGGVPKFGPDGRTLIIYGSRVQFWDFAELRKSLLPPNSK